MAIDHPSFGRLDDDRIIIFDTTLRDGEQSPGFSMNLAEKLRMAEALAALGVDVMEAGFPIASPGDFDSVRSIAELFAKDGPVVCGLSRSAPGDIASAVLARVASADLGGFWIHLDADVLNPAVMPAVDSPEPGGLMPGEFVRLIQPLVSHPAALGLSVTIYDPALDADRSCARQLVSLLETLLAPATNVH